MPSGLDQWDWFCLMMYERYHWSYDQCENLPAHHMNYIGIVAAAISKIHEDAQRDANRKR